jgi:hypothetical protein
MNDFMIERLTEKLALSTKIPIYGIPRGFANLYDKTQT